jgi:hypothetical protein
MSANVRAATQHFGEPLLVKFKIFFLDIPRCFRSTSILHWQVSDFAYRRRPTSKS